MQWLWIGGAVGVLIAVAQAISAHSELKSGARQIVRNNVANFAVKGEINRLSAQGYDLKSDSVHTFGKHTLVFVKRGADGASGP
jgi:hypothetical protein